ncbi:MAG: FliH/SctL family protein [Desulfobacteria bacterium]|nr:FliH/SctL family protein [Deltaproteobacteria bacterium]
MYKRKFASDAKVSKFYFPSFEGIAEPTRTGRPEGTGARPSERTPEDVEREAHIRGFEAGEKAGAESVSREAASLLDGLRCAIDAVRVLREQITREAEPQVVELAVAIARRIVMEELSACPDRIVAIVKEAIRRIERAGPVTIKVHPDLYNLVAGVKAGLAESRTEILFDIDPSVSPSGPVVMGTSEEVLTDVDDQIRTIVDDMRSARAGR